MVTEISPEFEPTTAERVARNDALFREANERIREKAEEYGVDIPVPFICECADPACREVVRVELDGYREVRRNPRWFINVPGHEVAAGSAAEAVGDRDGYRIVQKVGRAGEIVEALDGRPEGDTE